MSTEDKATSQPKTPYTVKNIKYGEKTVRGRVIGRAKTVIPEEQVLELARLHCTNQEMADFFEVKLQTFMDNFRDIITKGRLETKQRLRAAQLKVALDGNTTMLIFLGKNYLNQSDQPINTSEEKILPWLEESGTS
jgi:helix-turn-helix protein